MISKVRKGELYEVGKTREVSNEYIKAAANDTTLLHHDNSTWLQGAIHHCWTIFIKGSNASGMYWHGTTMLKSPANDSTMLNQQCWTLKFEQCSNWIFVVQHCWTAMQHARKRSNSVYSTWLNQHCCIVCGRLYVYTNEYIRIIYFYT